MLNGIKSIINRKEEFLESAQIIYEDAINDIENRIVEDVEKPDPDEDPKDDELNNNPDDTGDPDIDNEDDNDPEELDIMGMDINDPDGIIPDEGSSIFDQKLDDGIVEDDDSAILSMTIDIKTNTLTDILPVPPLNAGDALTDNVMSTKVEDGFTEAISIDAGADDTTSDVKPDDGKPAAGANAVTDAVIDKVNDATAPTNTNTPDSSDADAKDKLLDKLDKLNKGIMNMKEDIKKYIP